MPPTKFRILCILAVLIGIPVLPDLAPVKAFSDVPSSSNDNAEAVIQVERNIFAALKQKDTKALGLLLDEKFVFRTPGIPDATRDSFLKMAAQTDGEILSIGSDDMKVNIYGDHVAILTGIQDSKVQLHGRHLAVRQIFTDVFRYRSGHWLCVLAYSAELAPQLKPHH